MSCVVVSSLGIITSPQRTSPAVKCGNLLHRLLYFASDRLSRRGMCACRRRCGGLWREEAGQKLSLQYVSYMGHYTCGKKPAARPESCDNGGVGKIGSHSPLFAAAAAAADRGGGGGGNGTHLSASRATRGAPGRRARERASRHLSGRRKGKEERDTKVFSLFCLRCKYFRVATVSRSSVRHCF